jgi:hypothetical protein
MAYTPAELGQMIEARATHPDPSMAAVEAVLLRSAFERLDDFLHHIELHAAHAGARAVVRLTDDIRHQARIQVSAVDMALDELDGQADS